MKFIGDNNSYFEVGFINTVNASEILDLKPSELLMIWFQSDGNQIEIDNIKYTFNANDILCLTEFHKVQIKHITKSYIIKWNKYFYCIINHDSQVGCKGILFYGAVKLPVIHLNKQNVETLSIVWQMLLQEMEPHDNLQEEMLQMMLKRILILCTRIYKDQSDFKKVDQINIDIIREYHFLVEQYFKEKHTVAEYAELLNKSPKTLSNIFHILGSKTPHQYIKDRRMLEARRLLAYTDKTISEVGYAIGFADVQAFSRFFKKEEGISPMKFRK